jgi:hypothetical protein
MKKNPEYVEGRKAFENFDNVMDALMKVPHSEIKAKLDAEKRAKKKSRNRASRRGVENSPLGD